MCMRYLHVESLGCMHDRRTTVSLGLVLTREGGMVQAGATANDVRQAPAEPQLEAWEELGDDRPPIAQAALGMTLSTSRTADPMHCNMACPMLFQCLGQNASLARKQWYTLGHPSGARKAYEPVC